MKELPKAFDPSTVEKKWYRFWEEGGFFKPKEGSDPFCIVMPPPNVTGVLHMGHALVSTLQDVLIRYQRMEGKQVLWVPGTDHAGIATQTVVERDLIKREGKRRSDFERDAFLEIVWAWKEKSEKRIVDQFKQVGCSCDWDHYRFTMDAGCNKAVRTLFKKLYEDGLIYRGDYLVNWDPVTQTALADDEVEYEQKTSNLWYIRYPIEGSDEHLVVATTRPETMLGDTAVAVNEKDERYAHHIGKQIRLPITDRLVPIIADSYVDPEFGTGVVKITPAHDPNDYEIGLRHKLPMINLMTPDGKIDGLSTLEMREKVVSQLESANLIEKIEPHEHRVGISYRSKATIEPYLSKQWFVKLSHFKKPLIEAVKKNKVELIPKTWENTYFHWIDNLRDWCISRQLWWGHRIPIWYHKDDPEKMICHDGEGIPDEVAKNPGDWEQDPDVLDTWFSSALWPFSTLGWPEKTSDLTSFYPNAVLITGHDILFFWVARMIAMGEYAMGKVPFPKTFLHGLIYGKSYWRVQDDGSIHYVSDKEQVAYDLGEKVPSDVHSKWEKMSKSKGNVIDPIEIISSYGADAMRMALCASASHARQIDLDRRRFEDFKNFANKVWNGARFIFMNIEGFTGKELSSGLDEKNFTLEDRWILSVLARTVKEVRTQLNSYNFHFAAQLAYDFFWKEFCAYYIELSKPILFGKEGDAAAKETKQKLLIIILCTSIRLLHPMAPYITEELFQALKEHLGPLSTASDLYTKETIEALLSPACITAPFPKPLQKSDEQVEHAFQLIYDLIHAARMIRTDMQIAPSQSITLYLNTKNSKEKAIIEENLSMLRTLIKSDEIILDQKIDSSALSSSSLVGNTNLTIPLPKELIEKEKQRLLKTQEKLTKEQNRMQSQLANEQFVERAPTHLVEKLREDLKQTEQELTEIAHKLEHIG